MRIALGLLSPIKKIGSKQISRSREHYEKALLVYDTKDFLSERVTARVILGAAFETIPLRSYPAATDVAISLYEGALAVITRERAPDIWAFINARLGRLYLTDSRQAEQERFEKSAEHLASALEVYTPTAFPREHDKYARLYFKVSHTLHEQLEANSYEDIQEATESGSSDAQWRAFIAFRDQVLIRNSQLFRAPPALLLELFELVSKAPDPRGILPDYVSLNSLLTLLRAGQHNISYLRGPKQDPDTKILDALGPVALSEVIELSAAYRAFVPPDLPEPGYATVKVFYATDRRPTGNAAPRRFFVNGRDVSADAQLSFGTCDVSIPRDHRMGALEHPSIWKVEFRTNPKKHVALLRIQPLDRDTFYSLVEERLRVSQKREAFVFIHGYNVSFEDAVRRTAQIAYDLGFDGTPIAYSWPSHAKAKMYLADEATVEATVPFLAELLTELQRSTGAHVIHIIAHSMGNRALMRAAQSFVTPKRKRGSTWIRQIVLAAPDVDAQVFSQLASTLRASCERVTLYASSRDLALRASKIAHAYPRAGESGGNIGNLPRIVDRIDASAVDTNLLGHSYYGDNRSVLADIFSLVRDGFSPDKRFGMVRVGMSANAWWAFRP